MFSDKVKKINMMGWKQERILVITNETIYNIKKTKAKRKITIASLGGVSKTMTGAKIEFTLHVNKSYDYRFLSEKREEIIDILKQRFAEKMKDNLAIYGIDKATLTDFTTTEKDMKRGVSKYPPTQLRLKQEDLIKVDSPVQTSKSGVGAGIIIGDKEVDNTFEFQEEFQENVEIRNKQYQESKNFQDKGEDDDDDEEEEEEDENGVKEPTAR